MDCFILSKEHLNINNRQTMPEAGMNFQPRICRLPQNIFGCIVAGFFFLKLLTLRV